MRGSPVDLHMGPMYGPTYGSYSTIYGPPIELHLGPIYGPIVLYMGLL